MNETRKPSGMRNARRLLVLVAALTLSTECSGQQQCAERSPDELLAAARSHLELTGTHFPDLHSQPVFGDTSPGTKPELIATSWEGPRDGALLLVACDGHLLDARRTGFVVEVSEFPQLTPRIRPTLVRVVAHHGTGYWMEQAIIAAVIHDSIAVLWSGTVRERDVTMTESGFEVERVVHVHADGARFSVTGSRWSLTNEGVRTDEGPLDEEEYCWSSGTMRFVLCATENR